MKIELEIHGALPCATKLFKINGVKSDKDWFVNNYDNKDGEEIEYGCNNRVTYILPIDEVRKQLPKELKTLSDNEIESIQEELERELVTGGCGWCV